MRRFRYHPAMLLKNVRIGRLSRAAAIASAIWLVAGCSTVHSPTTASADPHQLDAAGWQQQLAHFARAQSLPAVLLLGEQHDAPAHQ